MARKHTGEEKPIFDFSTYSVKEQKLQQRHQMRLLRLAEKIDRFDEWKSEDDWEEACDRFEDMQNEAILRTARRVVSIPRSWLVPGAPDELDWKQLESWDWLQAVRQKDIVAAAVEATNPESVSGN